MSTKPTTDRLHILSTLLETRLADIDLTRAAQEFPTPEALATRMLEAVPDAIITEPPIGPCYSSPSLARWEQVSRQAISQQRQAGKLFGVKVGGSYYFPSVQFDRHGRQRTAFTVARTTFEEVGGSELEFAIWLQTTDPEAGVTPAAEIDNAPDQRTAEERLVDGFRPTIVEPPVGSTPAGIQRNG
jgi:hypothetical protein